MCAQECSKQTAHCVTFSCPLKNMSNHAEIKVRSRVWNSTMLEVSYSPASLMTPSPSFSPSGILSDRIMATPYECRYEVRRRWDCWLINLPSKWRVRPERSAEFTLKPPLVHFRFWWSCFAVVSSEHWSGSGRGGAVWSSSVDHHRCSDCWNSVIGHHQFNSVEGNCAHLLKLSRKDCGLFSHFSVIQVRPALRVFTVCVMCKLLVILWCCLYRGLFIHRAGCVLKKSRWGLQQFVYSRQAVFHK